MEHTRKLQESDVEKIVRKAKFNVKNFQISNPEFDRCYEKNYGNLTARLTLNDVNLEIEDLGSMHILKVIDNSGIVRGTYDGRNPGCGGMNFSSAELSLHELNNQIKKGMRLKSAKEN